MIKTETRLSVSDSLLVRLSFVVTRQTIGILYYYTVAEMHIIFADFGLSRLGSRSRVLKSVSRFTAI